MNFSYTTNPSYVDLVSGMYKAMRWHYRADNWDGYTFPNGFFKDMVRYYDFPLVDMLPILYFAILFTVIRYLFEIFICKPLTSWLKIESRSDREKFPESFWKFFAYCVLWSYCSYVLVFSGRHNYFSQPYDIWDDWSIGMQIPDEIQWLYFIECGFYFHSVYATLFMDTKRKDFLVMLFHHFLTMILLIVSFATRYHKIGILVVFLHDVTDILLEFTKCHVYVKKRNGKFYAYNEHISNIGFVGFTITWFVFRLYWYPLKVLYSSGVVAAHRAYIRGAGLYGLFNLLLWFLLFLNLYWFYFILLFLYKVATGQLKEINDTRDLEDETQEEKNKKKKK